ncbi:MAG: hypothetical protein KAF27_08700 [Porphyrobacter sp.]|nr:hypothetical protein [Porphyrobacter sp.]
MPELLDFLNAYRAPAQHIASLLLLAMAWRWGGGPERWLTTTFVGTMVLPVYLTRWLTDAPLGVSPFSGYYTMIDVVAAGLFVGVALNANRNYPLWVAGFQIVALGAHMVHAIPNSASPLGIAILVIGPSYCQLLLLGTGFIRHVQRQRRFGPYREWRVSSPLAGGTPR